MTPTKHGFARRLAFALCGLMILGAPATAASAPAKPQAARPAIPDDPAKIAAAKEFLLLYRPQVDPRKFAAQLNVAMPSILGRAKAREPNISEKELKAFAQRVRTRYMKQATENFDLQVRAIARHFTLAELKGLIAFCRSPLGRKLIEETPKIQRDVFFGKRALGPRPPLPKLGKLLSGPPAGAPKPAAPRK